MKEKKQKSFYAKPSTIDRQWRLIDAEGQILGRLASEIASIVRGKDKPTYTPSMNMGDFVVVTNAEKIKVTGKKLTDKVYYRHTGYAGGIKATTLKDQLAKDARKVILSAVKGMLPHNRLGRELLKKVKVYNGSTHPHSAQLAGLDESTQEVKEA